MLRTFLEVEYAKYVERRYLTAADVVDVVSSVDLGWLASVAPRANVRVVPLGTPPIFRAPPTTERSEGHDILLFSAAPGLLAFLTESLPVIRSVMPSISIAMIGPPPMRGALDSLSASGGHYLGFVEDANALVRSARVVVAPSQQRSGTSNKAIQAMLLGVPVAGGRCVFGVPGALPGQHFMYGATPSELAAAVLTLLSDENLTGEIVQSAFELADSLPSWTEVANSYLTSLSPVAE